MNLNELRIGNYVQGDTDGVYQWELSDFYDWYNDHNSHEYGQHVHPIPLTEEWLVKFGFELMPWGWVITVNVKNKKYISNGIRITKGLYFERDNGGTVKIEFVHQLQNLYFALTGEELEVNAG